MTKNDQYEKNIGGDGQEKLQEDEQSQPITTYEDNSSPSQETTTKSSNRRRDTMSRDDVNERSTESYLSGDYSESNTNVIDMMATEKAAAMDPIKSRSMSISIYRPPPDNDAPPSLTEGVSSFSAELLQVSTGTRDHPTHDDPSLQETTNQSASNNNHAVTSSSTSKATAAAVSSSTPGAFRMVAVNSGRRDNITDSPSVITTSSSGDASSGSVIVVPQAALVEEEDKDRMVPVDIEAGNSTERNRIPLVLAEENILSEHSLDNNVQASAQLSKAAKRKSRIFKISVLLCLTIVAVLLSVILFILLRPDKGFVSSSSDLESNKNDDLLSPVGGNNPPFLPDEDDAFGAGSDGKNVNGGRWDGGRKPPRRGGGEEEDWRDEEERQVETNNFSNIGEDDTHRQRRKTSDDGNVSGGQNSGTGSHH